MNGREWEKHHRIACSGILNSVTRLGWREYCYQHHRDRERDILRTLVGKLENPRVLFVGCGTGEAAVSMWPATDATLIGIELNYDLASEAKSRLGVLQGDALALPFPAVSYDVVFYDLVLHHLVGQAPLEDFLREGSRVLRPGGYLVAYEPSSFYPSNVALNLLNRFGLMKWISGASPTEFALSPRVVCKLLRRLVGPTTARGTTYCWRRIPRLLQRLIREVEPIPLRHPLWTLFGWHVVYVAEKVEAQQTA